jgi:hypothetical protein
MRVGSSLRFDQVIQTEHMGFLSKDSGFIAITACCLKVVSTICIAIDVLDCSLNLLYWKRRNLNIRNDD